MKVTYDSHMGSDLKVANMARVSFAKKKDAFDDKDAKLIQYLAAHNHWAPFGHCVVTLHISAPIAIRTQLFKHKIGLIESEVSRRYVDAPPEFFTPTEWRGRAENKKQGSSGIVNELNHDGDSEDLWGDIDNKWHPSLHVQYCMQHCLEMYNRLIQSGVCPEQARFVLPQATYTEWYWTGSLAAYARVYKLRHAEDAQKETQEIAGQIGAIMKDLFPVSWEALTNDKI